MTHLDGPYPCYFKCGAKLQTKFDRIAVAGWTWFTGAGKSTAHFCPLCRFNRRDEVVAMARARGIGLCDEIWELPYPALTDELPKIEEPT